MENLALTFNRNRYNDVQAPIWTRTQHLLAQMPTWNDITFPFVLMEEAVDNAVLSRIQWEK